MPCSYRGILSSRSCDTWTAKSDRSIVRHPGLGPLLQDTYYGIELFKARWLWNSPQANPNYVLTVSPGRSEFNWVFTRPRPEVIIRQRRRQQVQGGSSRMGTVGEMPGDEGDDCSLGQALKPSGANGAMHTRMQGGTVFCER